MTRRCAVLGSPIAHSLSPVMHRTAYDALGLDWTYDALAVTLDGLDAFLRGLDPSWRGLSLTMPLKRAVLPMLDGLDEHARLSQAANTVVLGEDGRLGLNTDVPGAAAAMAERLTDPVRSAVVLGGGATATSVLVALAARGCASARLLVRDPARAQQTAAIVRSLPDGMQLDVGRLDDVGEVVGDLIVSTVPAAAQTPELVAACAGVPAVFEVVYDPWPTPLAKAAEDTGRPLITGLDLLAHQALLQLEAMTGGAVEVDLLRDAGREELARRAVQNAPQPPTVS